MNLICSASFLVACKSKTSVLAPRHRSRWHVTNVDAILVLANAALVPLCILCLVIMHFDAFIVEEVGITSTTAQLDHLQELLLIFIQFSFTLHVSNKHILLLCYLLDS